MNNKYKRLREKTGMGLYLVKKALDICQNDELLAEGWLRYAGCAISVKPINGETEEEAKNKWIMNQAKGWAKQHDRSNHNLRRN